jgi:uncharacterized protein YbjT (DUF2867 family)
MVTGATGNIGARVVRGLLALGHRPRVLIRDAAKAHGLFGDDVDYAVGDLSDEASLDAAFAGARAVFLVNDGPKLALRDAMAARSAKRAGVGRLVKLSSQGARASGPPTAVALWHAEGESAIRDSGLPYTFVRSVGFMSNALGWAAAIKATGTVRASTGEGRIAMIHPDDLAAVVIVTLTSPDYEGAVLPVTGPEPLTYAEMTAAIGAAIGRSLGFVAVSDEEARMLLSRIQMPSALAEALVTLWSEVRQGLVSVVTGEVERVTGKRPIPFAVWSQENAAAFR